MQPLVLELASRSRVTHELGSARQARPKNRSKPGRTISRIATQTKSYQVRIIEEAIMTTIPPYYADNNANAAMVGGGGKDFRRTSDSDDESLDLGTVPEEERFKGKPRSPWKVLDKYRRIKKVSGVVGVGTDDTEIIDPTFAADIKDKVILLKFDCWNQNNCRHVPYLGQAAILRSPKGGIAKFATCMHNLVTDLNENGELEICLPTHVCVLANQKEAFVTLPYTGWIKTTSRAIPLRDGVTWSYGFDVSLGPVLDEQTGAQNWPYNPFRAQILNEMVSNLKSFDLVDDDFSYVVGLKIGIVCYVPQVGKDVFLEAGRPSNIKFRQTFSNAVKLFTTLAIATVCGKEKEDVMIYTGIITNAGNDQIEYNVNTYKGVLVRC